MTEPEKIKKLYEQLLAQKLQFFPEKGPLGITCEPGVYIIYGPHDEVAHVGTTPRGKGGLCQRLTDHIGGSSSFARSI